MNLCEKTEYRSPGCADAEWDDQFAIACSWRRGRDPKEMTRCEFLPIYQYHTVAKNRLEASPGGP